MCLEWRITFEVRSGMTYIETLLGEHEKVIFLTHQHWMRLVPSFLGYLALAIFVVAIAFIVDVVMLNPIGLLAAVLLVVPVVLFLRQYLEWLNQEYIITNRRVIQIEGVV